ncbi:glycosyltransferase family 2 protein [Thiospirillum jenense]|uniref:Glycosyltransferase family 2 protein n=1 Tax=Thiospirillum jenense TaxID=1653858 RepID=A0A839HAL8_9GAMM|nr:glycosyltransferase family 2 protein [Thiospirillum jenense]MBB1126125.1 glycosyltransferase family 2 protein [Thiospirillum jenense]
MTASLMTSPRCAILIVNWNSWALLRDCLTAVMQQSYRNYRVLVADNASTTPLPPDLQVQFPDVLFIHNETNLGFAAANNELAALCTDCAWIALLNPDAFPAPDWLAHLMNAAQTAPNDVAVFGSRLIMHHDRTRLDGDGDLYHLSGLAARINHNQVITPKTAPEWIFSACAAAALYRRDSFLTIGGFDTSYFCYFEDVDLGFRLQLAGYRCLLIPSAIAYHVGSATSGSQESDFALYHGHRNLVWTFIKNMPGVLFWLLLPYHVLLNLFTIAILTRRGRGRIIIRAKIDALRGLPMYWQQRRLIQQQRQVSWRVIWHLLDKRNPVQFLRTWQRRRSLFKSVYRS